MNNITKYAAAITIGAAVLLSATSAFAYGYTPSGYGYQSSGYGYYGGYHAPVRAIYTAPNYYNSYSTYGRRG